MANITIFHWSNLAAISCRNILLRGKNCLLVEKKLDWGFDVLQGGKLIKNIKIFSVLPHLQPCAQNAIILILANIGVSLSFLQWKDGNERFNAISAANATTPAQLIKSCEMG